MTPFLRWNISILSNKHCDCITIFIFQCGIMMPLCWWNNSIFSKKHSYCLTIFILKLYLLKKIFFSNITLFTIFLNYFSFHYLLWKKKVHQYVLSKIVPHSSDNTYYFILNPSFSYYFILSIMLIALESLYLFEKW